MGQVDVGDGCLSGCAGLFLIFVILVVIGFSFVFSTIVGIILAGLFILIGIIKLIIKILN